MHVCACQVQADAKASKKSEKQVEYMQYQFLKARPPSFIIIALFMISFWYAIIAE